MTILNKETLINYTIYADNFTKLANLTGIHPQHCWEPRSYSKNIFINS